MEIEKLKGELMATRQRNGVYLSATSYEEITEESESRRILCEEQKAKIETMEANLRNKVQELFALTSNFNNIKKDNEYTKQILDDTKELLEKTEFVLENTRQNLVEENALRKSHQSTEEKLTAIGGQLITTLEKTLADNGSLYSKIHRKSNLHALNRSGWESSQNEVADVTQLVEARVVEHESSQAELITQMARRVQNFVQKELHEVDATRGSIEARIFSFAGSENEVISQALGAKDEMNEILEEIKVLREDVKRKVGEGLDGLSLAAGRISAEVTNELEGFHTQVSRTILFTQGGGDYRTNFSSFILPTAHWGGSLRTSLKSSSST